MGIVKKAGKDALLQSIGYGIGYFITLVILAKLAPKIGSD